MYKILQIVETIQDKFEIDNKKQSMRKIPDDPKSGKLQYVSTKMLISLF